MTLLVRSLLLLICFATPSWAQHCGFDFSSIIIIRLEPTQAQAMEKLEAILERHGTFAFWKNELPPPGEKPRIVQTPSIIDSNSYWFADSNYVIAGPLGYRQFVTVIITYRDRHRNADTVFVSPESIYSLCHNYADWDLFMTDEIRTRFAPIDLDIRTIKNRDTIGLAKAVFITDKHTYHTADTISLQIKPRWFLIEHQQLKTDGRCSPSVIYGVSQRTKSGWKVITSIEDANQRGGAPFMQVFAPLKFTPMLDPGVYKLTFMTKDRVIESTPFEIVK